MAGSAAVVVAAGAVDSVVPASRFIPTAARQGLYKTLLCRMERHPVLITHRMAGKPALPGNTQRSAVDATQ